MILTDNQFRVNKEDFERRFGYFIRNSNEIYLPIDLTFESEMLDFFIGDYDYEKLELNSLTTLSYYLERFITKKKENK